MTWLVIAGIAAAGAYLVGWPAWRSSRERGARDTNAERYLAWRGRAPRESVPRERWTPAERRRLILAAALGLVALVALVAFFGTS
ncbi:MAG TPA: hypothetical protein VI277_01765 [Candidatus Limnocylindria bacterium]